MKEVAPSAPPKPQRFQSTDNYKPGGQTTPAGASTSSPALPSKPAKTTGPPVPTNRPAGPKVSTTNLGQTTSPSPSPNLRSVSATSVVSSPKDDKPKKEYALIII